MRYTLVVEKTDGSTDRQPEQFTDIAPGFRALLDLAGALAGQPGDGAVTAVALVDEEGGTEVRMYLNALLSPVP